VCVDVLENCRKENAVVTAQKCKLERELQELKQNASNQAALESETLWTKITASARELTRVEEKCNSLQESNDELRHENTLLKEQLQTAEGKLSYAESKVSKMTEALHDLQSLKKQLASEKLRSDSLKTELALANERSQSLESEIQQLRESKDKELVALSVELEACKSTITELTAKIKARQFMDADDDDDGEVNSDMTAVIRSLKDKLAESESKRRKLHNSLQDLRGNIRVYLRCRPFLPCDGEDIANSNGENNGCIKCNVGGTSVTLVGNTRGSGQTFTFDNVFSPSSSQEDVYKEVSELVQSALDGYRVCIFSYGQTNSGKTHTMSGEKYGAMRGIIPRSVEQLLQETLRLKDDGWRIDISTSIIEIYNEEVRDLLIDAESSKKSASAKDNGQIKISNISGKVTITGLVSVNLDTSDISAGQRHVCELLDHAAKLRCTASTSMNEHSSRSHLVFMVDIQAQVRK
jgi:kinesin family member C1